MNKSFYEATVLSSRYLTPGMLRLTFGGEGLKGFPGTGRPDEYVRLFFPNENTGRLHLPHIDEQGRWTYPDGGQGAIRCSTYTIRDIRQDIGELDIDFVVHEGGLASDWAKGAKPGDVVTLNCPHGLYDPPRDTAWQLLICDATGLPALSRILENTPQGLQSRVFVEIAQASHRQSLPPHPNATVTWLDGSGNGVAASQLGAVMHAVPIPATPGYIWVAGEQKVVRAIRKYVRHQLKMPAERYQLVGYWIDGGEAWDARWDAVPAEVKAAIEAGWTSGRDPELVRDEYEATLEKFGL